MKPLSRRTILRGAAAAAIALPWLEAMSPRKAQAATPTKRFIVMFSPNGTLPTQWTPTGTETSFTLSPILTPLAPHQGDLVIVEGLLQEGGGGDGHQNGIGGMLTGSPLNPGPFAGVGAPPAGWATGPSIDQRISQALASPTPFQSLELGVQVGPADNWGRMIYQAANQPLPPTDDPAQVYATVFSDLHTDPTVLAHLRTRHKSILDAVGTEYTRIGSQLGSADKQRLDAHLAAVREIRDAPHHQPGRQQSGRLSRPDGDVLRDAAGQRFVPGGRRAADGSDDHGAGLRPDQGRVVAVVAIGVAGAVHLARHPRRAPRFCRTGATTDTDAVSKLTQINTWYAQQMAYLIAGLKSTPDGAGGTLFDNTLILWSNELAKGNTHSRQDAPYVLAGNAGGGIRTGRFVSYEGQGLPHNNMMVSLLNAMDIPDTTFGKAEWCSGPLTGLL